MPIVWSDPAQAWFALRLYTKGVSASSEGCNGAPIPNHLQRRFHEHRPNACVVSDLTYVRVGAAWAYVCIPLDLHSRKIIGFNEGNHKDVALVRAAFASSRSNLFDIQMFHQGQRIRQSADGWHLVSKLISNIVLQLLSYEAQAERKNIRQRQSEGISAARARGVYLGRVVESLPESFPAIFEAWEAKTISRKDALEKLNVSSNHFDWLCKRYRRSLTGRADTGISE